MSRKISVFTLIFAAVFFDLTGQASVTGMMFGDTSRSGSPFSKDPHVISFGDGYLMYFSMQPYKNKNIPVQGPILKPELPWEKDCIEGASVTERNGKLYMFYASAYNNAPQQIGVAISNDGIKWKRLSAELFLANGNPGEWNSSESGHPHIFKDDNGRTYLFYQGNNDKGKT